MTETISFGRRATAVRDARTFLELERQEGKTELFADVDDLVARVAVHGLTGEGAIAVERGRRADSVALSGIDHRLEEIMTSQFSLASQHSRGAWFLPEKVSLKTGLVNLPALFARYPRFASGLAWDERARVPLADSAAAVFVWAVLQPLCVQLFLPFDLRGRLTGTKDRDDYLAAWAPFDELVSALELDVEDEVAVMRFGGGWSRLDATAQLVAKQRLLAALADQVNAETARLYRAYRMLPLVARYYEKAKRTLPRRKQVLTRALEPALSGFFGGDWLGFLGYLGEQPHPDERIAAALPATELFAPAAKDPDGDPGEDAMTPVGVEAARKQIEHRVTALKSVWSEVDQLHSQQSPGMRPLWGLVAESRGVRVGWNGPDSYSPELYNRLLPSKLRTDVERLWGSTTLPRWPERIVDEVSPHVLMAETFGAALHFWHGVGLTAWYVCEGPMSRTDIAGLATYYQDDLSELQRLSCPVDPGLFEQLRQAERYLGPPEPLDEEGSAVEIAPGIELQISMSTGSRRSGFERLRDIITAHRRDWAARYLDKYLLTRWEDELGDAGRRFAEATADRGKAPTPKQFARHALAATNHWFGGDLGALYMAIGERSPVQPLRIAMMPPDRLGFARRVLQNLESRESDTEAHAVGHGETLLDAPLNRRSSFEWLAEESLRFVQLMEALGRTPSMKDFGASGFQYRSSALASDPEDAWGEYAAVVESTLRTGARANDAPPTPFEHPAAPVVDAAPAALPPPPATPPSLAGPDEGKSRNWFQRLLGR